MNPPPPPREGKYTLSRPLSTMDVGVEVIGSLLWAIIFTIFAPIVSAVVGWIAQRAGWKG